MMLKADGLGIAVMQREGAVVNTLLAAQVMVPGINAALGLLLYPPHRGTQGGFGGNGSDVRRLVGEVSYHRPRGRLGRRRLGWLEILNRELGGKIELVGDDIFVTNVERIQRGIDENIANAVLIKLNQIGTLSESVAAVNLAYGAHWGAMVSHRSGETVIASLLTLLSLLRPDTSRLEHRAVASV